MMNVFFRAMRTLIMLSGHTHGIYVHTRMSHVRSLNDTFPSAYNELLNMSFALACTYLATGQ